MRLKRALFVFALFFLSCLPVCGAPAAPDEASDQQIDGFSLSGYGDRGKKAWDIAGKTADIFTDEVKLKDIDGNLYGKDEDVNLTAKAGNFNKKNGKVHLEEDVVITTSKGATLTTDSMDWDRNKQLVTTEDKVNIVRENMTIVGTGAHGEMNLKKVALNKDIRVDIKPKAGQGAGTADPGMKEKVVITCDGKLEIDYEKNIATFKDNVKVERAGSEIYSDIMHLYFSSDKNAGPQPDQEAGMMGNSKIDRIVAKGNVKIVRGENTSFSDEATYTAADKKIILSGRPKIVFYSTGDLKDASFGN
ncbi:MAG: LPS export ABC transporter periplasmic protein LptC [Candidatus Omnitrophota bacterium]